MRPVALAACMAFLLPLPVAAGSIDVISAPHLSGNSIDVIRCADCPAVAPKKPGGYEPPQLAPGTQTLEVRTVNGQKQLVRTEAWMGGSPVVFISKADGWLSDSTMLAASTAPPAIDGAATTAAVEPPAMTPAQFALRLN
ncbi:plant virulence effector HPE1-like domain-containing protein [Allorhizobium undicola]|uniref:plant virulence effector HPE1-like domain-containing protein n=1 Tax=Allorhizobium undicola TaxID=78527 RepID=UPI003D32AB8D